MRIVLLSLPATWSSSAGKVVQAFDADWFVLFRKLLERHFSAECETVVYKLTVSVVCRSLTWGRLCALCFRWWHILTLGVIGCMRPITPITPSSSRETCGGCGAGACADETFLPAQARAASTATAADSGA